MSQIETTDKPLPRVRLAARRTVVAAQSEIGAFVGPAFQAVAAIIGDRPDALETPIAEYDATDGGLRVTVGYAYDGPERDGIEIVELPAAESAVCSIHLGSMEHIGDSWMALNTEIAVRGLEPSGPCREVYVRADSDDQSDWVTELQQPVA